MAKKTAHLYLYTRAPTSSRRALPRGNLFSARYIYTLLSGGPIYESRFKIEQGLCYPARWNAARGHGVKPARLITHIHIHFLRTKTNRATNALDSALARATRLYSSSSLFILQLLVFCINNSSSGSMQSLFYCVYTSCRLIYIYIPA